MFPVLSVLIDIVVGKFHVCLGAVHKWRHQKGGGGYLQKGDQKMTGGRGVSEKGDVIYEQKYIGIGRQFRVFMPIITKYKVNYLAIK